MDYSILVVTGGNVDYEWAKQWLCGKEYACVIAADSGLEHIKILGLRPDYILGDYDSVRPKLLDAYRDSVETVVYPKEKDFTDTHLAILAAINRGASKIDIIGATGTRLDHMLTNVNVCKAALEAQVECCIYDANNKIYLVDDSTSHTIKKCEQYGDYVSIIPLTEMVVLSLTGFKYPLDRYELKQGLSICQSNEISEDECVINIHSGIAVVIEARD